MRESLLDIIMYCRSITQDQKFFVFIKKVQAIQIRIKRRLSIGSQSNHIDIRGTTIARFTLSSTSSTFGGFLIVSVIFSTANSQ